MIEKLIAKYEAELEALKEAQEEIDEMYEDYNPCDWSGGNFDDAYDIGVDHGGTFEAERLLTDFIENLKGAAKEGGQ